MLTPLLLSVVGELVGLAVALLVLVAGVAASFLSLRRLHDQMTAVRQEQLDWSRALYSEVYTPCERRDWWRGSTGTGCA